MGYVHRGDEATSSFICTLFHARDPPTHPIIASLDHPLFAARKEGSCIF